MTYGYNECLKSFSQMNPSYDIGMSALTTLYVENFFSEMREGDDMPNMLQFAYRFYSSIRINNKDIRIINKLTLCFRPDSVVTAEAAKISGLSNSLLEKMPQFDGEAVRVRKDFKVLDFFNF